ncbi:MAG TPA: HAD family acid phosphatase [Stellaceae bacterium]|nr:HAD family acid phosphatase [Stellaceae bacterium]
MLRRFGLAMRTPGLAVALTAFATLASPAFAADGVPQNDMLNAEVWMQTSVEYRANCLAVYALARLRLDQALADPSWTAYDQAGAYRDLPPAVILDLDETALDNSPYEAWLVVNHAKFDPKSWDAWVKARQAKAVPGAVEFAAYAAGKGVKVFYVSNRSAEQKEETRRNMAALGFPLGGNVDTLLMKRDRPEWSGNAKSARYAAVAKDYRVLLLLGDQFGDFTDNYVGSVAERAQSFDALKAHFGHDWLMLANPAYGSWEGAPYAPDSRLPDDAKRTRKLEALSPWQARP